MECSQSSSGSEQIGCRRDQNSRHAWPRGSCCGEKIWRAGNKHRLRVAHLKSVIGATHLSFNSNKSSRTEPARQPVPSPRSRFGLNAANFFQAEAVGVMLPVLNDFLREAHWRYDQIGFATALMGLGTLLFQTPAGILVDRVKARRMLFFVGSLAAGVLLGAIPLFPRTAAWIDPLLFVGGAVQSIFLPVLGALALALAGYGALNRMLGENQGWNHAGNIAAALGAYATIRYFGTASIFYSVAIASFLAAGSVFVIRRSELDEVVASGDGTAKKHDWRALLRDRRVLVLVAAVSAFHLANAPVLPLTALYIQKLGGSTQLTTLTVFSAQMVMIPMAWGAGRLCDSWGRKPVMAVAFWALPFRILSYTFTHNAVAVVVLQSLDGIGAGIFGVAIMAFAADLTRGKGRFNSLLGILATAQGIGAVAGPVLSGLLLQHMGFRTTFLFFAALALGAAILLQAGVPETRPEALPAQARAAD